MSVEFRRQGLRLYAVAGWDAGAVWSERSKKWMPLDVAEVREVRLDGRVLTEDEVAAQFPDADLTDASQSLTASSRRN